MSSYKLYRNEKIIEHQQKLIFDLYEVYDFFKETFPDGDSTWGYKYYNVFAATSPDPLWYEIFQDVKQYIRDYVGHNDPLWMQCWLNMHEPTQVLDWHNHDFPYHGYISIDPKNTTTEFRDWKIKNSVGNIYIGPGYNDHRVVVNDDYNDGPRITLGMDIITEPEYRFRQFSFIPI